jgi:hypothetical protein
MNELFGNEEIKVKSIIVFDFFLQNQIKIFDIIAEHIVMVPINLQFFKTYLVQIIHILQYNFIL